MTTERDIFLRKYKPQLDAKQDKYDPFRAVIVSSTGSRTTGSVWRDEARRLVWFQAWSSGAIGWALCDNIEPNIGLGVYVQFSPILGIHEVLRDDPFQRNTTSSRSSYRALTNQDFLKGGRFQLWIDPTMIQPLALYPGSSGLTVSIVEGDYIYDNTRKTYNGTVDYDISAEQPAGPSEHNLVGFYLDSSNVLNTVTGAAVSTAVDATEPVWPAGAFWLGVVDLDDTQTTIAMTDIDNRKVVWTEDDQTLSLGGLNNVDTTGAVYGDVLTYLPGLYAEDWVPLAPSGSGGGVWPKSGHLTNTDDGSDYTTVASLEAARSAGEQGIIGVGTYTADSVTIGNNGSYLGSGLQQSILKTTTNAKVLDLSGKTFTVMNQTIQNSYTTGNRYGLYAASSSVIRGIRSEFIGDGSGAGAIGALFLTGSTGTFYGCVFSASGATGNHAIYLDDSDATFYDCVVTAGDLTIAATGSHTTTCRNCTFAANITLNYSGITLNIDGGTIVGNMTITAGTVNLSNAPRISGTVTGTPTGFYIDSSGNLKSSKTTMDIYPDNDTFPVWSRLINWLGYSPLEHWHQGSDELTWTGWAAYTSYATPATITKTSSRLYADHSGATRAFYYRSYINAQTRLLVRVSVQTLSEAGVMVDDGVDNVDGLGADNFTRFFIESTSTTSNLNLAMEYRTGGGAVTKVTAFSFPPGAYYGIAIIYGIGTRWSAWATYCYAFNENGSLGFITNTPNVAWTPARHGLYYRNTGGATRGGMWDWFHEV